MLLADLLKENGNDLQNHDLAALADWAYGQKHASNDSEWKRAYALIREGADLLLRRRVRLSGETRHRAQEHTQKIGIEFKDGASRFHREPNSNPAVLADQFPDAILPDPDQNSGIPVVNSADFTEKEKQL